MLNDSEFLTHQRAFGKPWAVLRQTGKSLPVDKMAAQMDQATDW